MMELPWSGCLVIGEVAQAHDGSLGQAHAFIDAIADAGADAVKFQTHIAAAESTVHEPWRVAFSRQDASRYDYWKRMEFTEEQWRGLRRHAEHERSLTFLSSPFSMEALALLNRVGVSAWKVASGEVAQKSMLKDMAETRLPILLSTGMSPWAEIDAAVEAIRAFDVPLVVLQCTSLYPTPFEKVGLNQLAGLGARYGVPVGLSDHSGSIYPGLAAAALGASVVEVHVTLSRHMSGPDVESSLTPEELATLVAGVRAIETMQANPVAKDAMAAELAGTRRLFSKSLVARWHLPSGHALRAVDFLAKKPGTGIPPSDIDRVVGRHLRRELLPDEALTEAHLE